MIDIMPEIRSMPVTPDQIDSFYQFATERLDNGGAQCTIDELFELWRLENPTPEELHEDVLAVQASLRDMQNGETGRPFEEFSREFRRRNNLPADA